jgi:hypothetical protein
MTILRVGVKNIFSSKGESDDEPIFSLKPVFVSATLIAIRKTGMLHDGKSFFRIAQ